MARVVTCPSCQARGGIPDDAQVSRIRCPKCGTVYRIGGESSAAAAPPPPIAEGTRSGSSMRKAPAAAVALAGPAHSRSARHGPTGNSQMMLYGLVGLSGLVVVLIGVVMALLLRGGGPQGVAVEPGSSAPAVATNAGPQPGPPAATVAPAVNASELSPPATTTTAALVPTSATKVAVSNFSGASPAPAAAMTSLDRSAPLDPKEVLRRLKEATVLINTKLGKKTLGNGSGFVIEADGDKVLVATNRHVAVMDLSEAPPGLIPKGVKPTLEAVFRSGTGKDEQALPAQIIAADLSGDMSNDLAFLVVHGVKAPPKPIDPFDRFDPYEGMGYVGAGFPLGGILSQVTENRGNPSVTITRGGIAALRRDNFGQLSVLQADGSLQPGNSGGPIVDPTNGKLLGVAVAKISMVDTIGFVVPADHVRQALGGRVGGVTLFLEKSDPGKANLRVKANLVDPKLQVAGVEVRAAAVSSVDKPNPNSDGTWPALPKSQPVSLQRSPRGPWAMGRIQVELAGSGAAGRKVYIQAAHRDMRGRMFYSRPKEVFLPDHPGPIREDGSFRKIATQVMAKSLALLGALVDPSKDCRLDKDDKSLKVRIDVPGKLHTLSPAYRSPRGTPIHNAPMTLTDVDGDFLAQVSVVGEINPGAMPPKDRAARDNAFTFQSGGLVLYQDRNNFVRLERAASIITSRLTPIHRLLIEMIRDGRPAIEPIYLDIPEGDTTLLLIRRKGRLRCLFVPTGSRALHTFREFALNFPDKVKVGLTASNISAQPFSATFQRFALITDTTQIDQEMDAE